jgi:hypothetical protein
MVSDRVPIDVYLHLEHAVFVSKNTFRFRLLQQNYVIGDYFYYRQREENMCSLTYVVASSKANPLKNPRNLNN